MSKAVIRFGPILGILLALAGPARAANDQQIRAGINGAINFLKSSTVISATAFISAATDSWPMPTPQNCS